MILSYLQGIECNYLSNHESVSPQENLTNEGYSNQFSVDDANLRLDVLILQPRVLGIIAMAATCHASNDWAVMAIATIDVLHSR